MQRDAGILVWAILSVASGCNPPVSDRTAPAALAWRELPALPDPAGFAGPFAGVSGGTLIVAGGANFPGGRPWDGHPKVWHDRIFVLDGPAGAWSVAEAALPRPLAYGVSITIDEGILCLGGGDAERHVADAFLIRRASGRIEIEPLPPMPGPAAFFCGAQLGHSVYVAGGLSAPGASVALRTFWAFDLRERRWRVLEPWPGRPRMLAVAGSQDGAFYLMSGADLAAGPDEKPCRHYLKDAWRYAPAEGWTRMADLPRPAVAAPSPAPAPGQAHLLVVGGDDGADAGRSGDLRDHHPGFAADVLAYHTVTNTWCVVGAFPKDPGPDPAMEPARGTWPPVTTAGVPWAGGWTIPSGEARPGVRTPRVFSVAAAPRISDFRPLDTAVLVLYLLIVFVVGTFFAGGGSSTDEFFRGGRAIPWWAAGLSIYGTQLSAITFMAIPALVYRTDWVYLLGNVMILAVAPLIVHGYLPFFRRLDITSAYEYLEHRFHLAVRLVGSLAFLLFQLGRMGIVLFLPALALSVVTGFNVYLSIAVMGVLATAYTVVGGIRAVIWTDVVQVVVLLGGALASLVCLVLWTDGGAAGLLRDGLAEGKFRLANLTWDASTTALWVVVVGKLFEQLVPYTADQSVVQRYLTTPDERRAARAIWLNGILSVPGSVLFFAIGTALWAFYRTHPAALALTGRHDDIFPWFIVQELPPGVSGLVIAAIFAASMSSLDSSLNSMVTAITTDFYRRFRPAAGDAQCLRLARVLTLLLGVMGTGSAALLAALRSPSMWDAYLQILGLFGSGLAGLFAVGIFTRRAGAAGALLGFFASAAVLYLVSGSGTVHFFLYAAIGIATCVAVAWLTSFLLPGAPRDLRGLIWRTRTPENREASPAARPPA